MSRRYVKNRFVYDGGVRVSTRGRVNVLQTITSGGVRFYESFRDVTLFLYGLLALG